MKDYQIAGLHIAMNTFGRTAQQAIPYENEGIGEPDIVIQSNAEFVHSKKPHLSMDDCEYLSTGSSFYMQLLQYHGLMLHASCVVLDGSAYLFTAPSGTGKSTHTRLWLEHFGDRAFILNDDKPALRVIDGVWYAYGTPWSGKFDISRNVCVPIGGIAVLERGENNKISPLSVQDGLQYILGQVVRTRTKTHRTLLLENLDQLLTLVPLWKLTCNKNPDAALLSSQAMSALIKER